MKRIKEEILSIASDLREGFITSNEAKEQLLILFDVKQQGKQICDLFIKSEELNHEFICKNCGMAKWVHKNM